MSQARTQSITSSIVAVYPDHDAAERHGAASARSGNSDERPVDHRSRIRRRRRSPSGLSARATTQRPARPPEHGLEACWVCASVRLSWSYRE